jgi:hypothetical protein
VTYNLGNSLGSTFGVLLSAFGSGTRVTGNTKDARHLGLVEVWHQRSKEELGVGSVTSRVGNSLRSLGSISTVDLCIGNGDITRIGVI